jgi:hypothetical protein
LAVLAYSKTLNELETVNFVLKFIPFIGQRIFLTSEESLISLGVSVYGTLVGLGGINAAPLIEEAVTKCIMNLYNPEKRFASLLLLLELLRHAQFITFNKIRKYRYTDLFKSIIQEKKQEYRKTGLDLIDECVKEICKRDRHEQSTMLTNIFNDIFKERQEKDLDSDINFGVAFVIKCLLNYANKEIFEDNFFAICEFIDLLKRSKSISDQRIVMETFPVLANYNHENFQNSRYLNDSIEYLLKVLKGPNNHFKRFSLIALSKILEPYPADKVVDKAKDILEELFSEFRVIGSRADHNLLPCMLSISEKVQKYFTSFFSEAQIHELVNLLLKNGLNTDILNYLQFLLKVNLPEIVEAVEVKLLYTISYILLKNNFYRFGLEQEEFMPAETKVKIAVKDFKESLESTLKGNNKEVNNENLICVSLTCLSRFNFPTFASEIVNPFHQGLFVKNVALQYLDDTRPPVRKAAAKSVVLLTAQTKNGSQTAGLTHNVIFS